jgi:hypothetical protein
MGCVGMGAGRRASGAGEVGAEPVASGEGGARLEQELRVTVCTGAGGERAALGARDAGPSDVVVTGDDGAITTRETRGSIGSSSAAAAGAAVSEQA